MAQRLGPTRVAAVLLATGLLAAACGDAGDPAPQTIGAPAATTPAPPSTGSTAPPATAPPCVYPQELDPAVADRLIALEEANDGQWTVESAIEAVAELRPVLETGLDAPPPIDLSRLLFLLSRTTNG